MKAPVKRVVKYYTQDQINELVGYIVDDKMTIKAASEKANIHFSTGYGWHRRYMKDQKHDGPI
jgi:transposase